METIRPWPTGFVLGDTGNLRQLSPPTSLGVEVSPALAREAAFCNYPPQTTFERASGEPIHPDGNYTDVLVHMMLAALVWSQPAASRGARCCLDLLGNDVSSF